MCHAGNHSNQESRDQHQNWFQQEQRMPQGIYPNLADILESLIPPQRPNPADQPGHGSTQSGGPSQSSQREGNQQYTSPLAEAAMNFFQEVGRSWNQPPEHQMPQPSAPPPPPTPQPNSATGNEHPNGQGNQGGHNGPWAFQNGPWNTNGRCGQTPDWTLHSYFLFNWFSKMAHMCVLTGSLLILLGILLCMPHALLAIGTCLCAARMFGFRVGPLLAGAAFFGILMMIPSPILVALSTWVIFKTVLQRKGIFQRNYFQRRCCF